MYSDEKIRESEYGRIVSMEKETYDKLMKENAHLRRVNGIKLKKTTIKQSLVYANDEIESLRAKVKEARKLLRHCLMLSDKQHYDFISKDVAKFLEETK